MTVLLEDLAVGEEFVSAGRTLTEADIVAFAGLSGDFNPLHVDETWVRENTPFAGRIAHGLLVVAVTSGLRTPRLDDLLVLAYLDLSRSFVAPVHPGDTIRAHWSLQETRRSRSRPAAGVARFSLEVRNQHRAVVQRGTDVYLVAATNSPSPVPAEDSADVTL